MTPDKFMRSRRLSFIHRIKTHESLLFRRKKALQGLAQKVSVLPAQEVAADPSVAAERTPGFDLGAQEAT